MNTHVPDHELVMAADGELPANRQWEVEAHLAVCAVCRGRQAEFQRAGAEFATWYGAQQKAAPPASAGRMAYWGVAAVSACVAGLLIWGGSSELTAATPDPVRTPGVVQPVTAAEVCQPGFAERDRPISRELAGRVFRAYGIRDPGRGRYEVDYLITPALGGATEAGNMWPQPFSRGAWNAHAKDALEVHLRQEVCAGRMPLAEAQQELAKDWIGAYKRHFRTDRPLREHETFVKDPPWPGAGS